MICPVCKFNDVPPRHRKTWEIQPVFIKIEGNFTTYNYNGLIHVDLLACPKCGNVRIDNDSLIDETIDES